VPFQDWSRCEDLGARQDEAHVPLSTAVVWCKRSAGKEKHRKRHYSIEAVSARRIMGDWPVIDKNGKCTDSKTVTASNRLQLTAYSIRSCFRQQLSRSVDMIDIASGCAKETYKSDFWRNRCVNHSYFLIFARRANRSV